MKPSNPAAAAGSAGTPRPVVALLADAARGSECDSLAHELGGSFAASRHPSGGGAAPQLVIWLCAAAGVERANAALSGVSPACPVIAIVDGARDIAPHLLGRRIADFVVKPYTPQELVLRAQRVLGLADPPGAVQDRPRRNLDACVVGTSPALARVVERLRRFAACDAGVLVLGETGSGKEVFAQATHYLSARSARPMVAVNCGAVPPELMEAELFGHVKGAYTNAHIARAGLVQEAEHGTLFLDDVDCLPLAAQAKLLRFLQEREYRVVGSNQVRQADVRVIAASNRNLADMAREGTFRQDLFYRLNVLTLSLPPLRDHKEDIPALARHFLERFAHRYDRAACHLSPAALLKLVAYDWPGNVREFGHVLERAALLCRDCWLEPGDIDLPVAPADAVPPEDFRAMKARVVQSFEKSYIETVLSSTRGNITEAARLAGKNRRALFELIRKHDITADTFRGATPH